MRSQFQQTTIHCACRRPSSFAKTECKNFSKGLLELSETHFLLFCSVKTGQKTKKSMHVITRLDLSKEMMAVNTIIGGVHLVDSLGRPQNSQLHFQVQGSHWVLPIDSEVAKFAEDDILLALFDVLYAAGFELISQYDQSISSAKGIGEAIARESWLFQRVRAIPVFNTQ